MIILTLLQQILGTYIKQADEALFHCPFCHHKKKKLSVNLDSLKWKCWTCNSKGGHIIWLLKKLNLTKQQLNEFKEVLKDIDFKVYKATTTDSKLFLPPEFKPLWKPEKSYEYLHAITYLKQRGIRTEDIIRYRMGYCESGKYAGRVIIPSYDANNQLNYFIARAYHDANMRYKNPPVSKNIVAFENLISWNEEIILCEGMFDAIALRKNAIPLLGKTLPSSLEKKLLEYKVREVTIFLDVDAKDEALRLEQHLKQYNINTKLVLTEQKDASDMGFNEAWKVINEAESTDFKKLISQRLSTT
jgi:DNA primase